MSRKTKIYTLKNGYKVSQNESYNGYFTQFFWAIWKPSGELYMNCSSREEAIDIAASLTKEY